GRVGADADVQPRVSRRLQNLKRELESAAHCRAVSTGADLAVRLEDQRLVSRGHAAADRADRRIDPRAGARDALRLRGGGRRQTQDDREAKNPSEPRPQHAAIGASTESHTSFMPYACANGKTKPVWKIG